MPGKSVPIPNHPFSEETESNLCYVMINVHLQIHSKSLHIFLPKTKVSASNSCLQNLPGRENAECCHSSVYVSEYE